MRITVIGATGGIGTEVTRQALAAGHEVTAPVRRPERMSVAHERLSVERVDVGDPEQLRNAMKGSDAIVSALGPRPGQANPTVLRDGARAALTAMREAEVTRLVIVSADGAFIEPTDGPVMRYVLKPIVMRVLREHFVDVRAMEALVRGSDADWTIVRPPRLTDKPGTGRYRTALDGTVRRGVTIARADVAHAILRAIADPGTIRHVVGVAN
jgi:putative NADH-flavin reductase